MSQPVQHPDWSVSTYRDSEKHIVVVENGEWMDGFSTIRHKELAQFGILDGDLDVDIPFRVQQQIARKLEELNPYSHTIDRS